MARIAVFEKEALVGLDIKKTLQQVGYEVYGPFFEFTARSVREDLDSCDLAILDFELVTSIPLSQELPQTVPIILVTALSDDATLVGARRINSFGLLVKPFSAQELRSTVDIALYRSSMEKKLAQSERRYRELFDFSMTARCIIDFDGRIEVTNKAFRALFGLEEGANLKSAIRDAQVMGSLCARVRGGAEIERFELPMTGANGLNLQVIGAFSIIDFSGARLSERGTQRISAEFYDETEPRRLREDLHQAQKMESLGRLAGGIAHDFNNILTAILGHAEMLKLETGPKSDAAEDVEGILDATERARRLTQQLLSFSRKQPFSPQQCDAGQIARDSVKLLKKLAGDDILLSVFVADNSLPIFADPMQIEQVLINLVANARDALEGRENPRISVIVEKKYLYQCQDFRGVQLQPGDYATIEVADNGVGMSEDVVAQAFEPYFTTKLMGKGTGLGLAIVASVASALSGGVELHSVSGKGTSIALWIPLLCSETTSKEINAAKTTGSEVSQPNWSPDELHLDGSPSILVVDDDEALLGFLATALGKAGAEVSSARNGGEALLLTERKSFDSFVIDINLPGLNGLNLYERLSSESRKRCIFMTGRLDSDFQLPEGMPLLQKPFTPGALVKTIGVQLSPSQSQRRKG